MTGNQAMGFQEAGALLARVEAEVSKVVIGQARAVREAILTAIAGGHAILEGVPGTAKTLLVRVLAKALGCGFARIQFTPDLMPADITGVGIPEGASGGFAFRKGPIFTDLLLADEINRAPAKTQAALLEAMQERQVTSDGVRHAIGDLFTVFATQNPVEFEGTYRLPEAELDRFLLKIEVGYPEPADEERILDLHRRGFDADREATFGVQAATDAAGVRAAREAARRVRVEDRLLAYIREIVAATRRAASVSLGASPRASVALLRAAQARALLEGRDFVVPDDVKGLARPALRHRLVLHPEFEIEGAKPDDVIGEILDRTEVPK
ncbi:MAG TPA: MoxR family ATPase [Planctomycetota bacterium]|jgi:MoxR-like ATPase|nr:MoxR family ATPase [Planctomycetota bacterium]